MMTYVLAVILRVREKQAEWVWFALALFARYRASSNYRKCRTALQKSEYNTASASDGGHVGAGSSRKFMNFTDETLARASGSISRGFSNRG